MGSPRRREYVEEKREAKGMATAPPLDGRLKTLATREDVSSVKVWFVVTSVALVALVATVAGAIVAG